MDPLLDTVPQAAPADDDRRNPFAELAARYPKQPVTFDTFNHLVELCFDIRAFCVDMNERNKERNTRIAAIETRLATLENGHTQTLETDPVTPAAGKPKWKYRGEWSSDGEYLPNEAVLRHGKLFICGAGPLSSDPAGDPVCWQAA
jgi:hypothetical protein